MLTKDEKISLINLGDGEAVELFDRALEDVLANVGDINTTASVREVTLKVQIKPNEDRTMVALQTSITSKKAPPVGFATQALLDLDERGRSVARELKKRQRHLPLGNVSSINKDPV